MRLAIARMQCYDGSTDATSDSEAHEWRLQRTAWPNVQTRKIVVSSWHNTRQVGRGWGMGVTECGCERFDWRWMMALSAGDAAAVRHEHVAGSLAIAVEIQARWWQLRKQAHLVRKEVTHSRGYGDHAF